MPAGKVMGLVVTDMDSNASPPFTICVVCMSGSRR